MNREADSVESRKRNPWLLLVHQIPPRPAYVRVRIGRRLHRLGAVAVKNSVWALPHREASLEDFGWIAEEIRRAGGEASLIAGSFVFGQRDADVRALFLAAREADYRALLEEIRKAEKDARRARKVAAPPGEPAILARFKRRAREIEAIDFFAAESRVDVETALEGLAEALRGETATPEPGPSAPLDPRRYRGRVWTTRPDVGIDRIASAWLVRRFVDRRARFGFATASSAKGKGKGDVRFDMPGGEFTHEGEKCTFEVLVDRFRLADAGLRAIGEIVHELDLKDGKYARPEAAGVARVVAGICAAQKSDEARIERGFAMFEDLLAGMRRGRHDSP